MPASLDTEHLVTWMVHLVRNRVCLPRHRAMDIHLRKVSQTEYGVPGAMSRSVSGRVRPNLANSTSSSSGLVSTECTGKLKHRTSRTTCFQRKIAFHLELTRRYSFSIFSLISSLIPARKLASNGGEAGWAFPRGSGRRRQTWGEDDSRSARKTTYKGTQVHVAFWT